MIHKLLIIIPCLLIGIQYSHGLEEITSANGGDRLKKFYDRFEKSDLNGDGVLTVDEMHDYLDDQIKDGTQSEKVKKKDGGVGGFKGLKSRVYLTIFLQEVPTSDINNDGILTKEELLEFVLSQRKVINEKGEVVPAPPKVAAVTN